MTAPRIVGTFIVAACVLGTLGGCGSGHEEVESSGPAGLVGEAENAVESEVAHAEESGGANPLVFDPDLAIFTAIVFLLLMAVLGKYAWPQITAALEAREKHIADNIAAAEGKHEESKKLLAGYEAKLAAAADEVRAMLEEARRDAEYTKNQIVAEARQAASEERDRAVREVELAKDASMKELAERSAALAIDLAGRFVRVSLSPEQQSDIVRRALDDLDARSPSRN